MRGIRQRLGNAGSYRTAWWWMQPGSNRSPRPKFPANREIYREFCRIWPFAAIFVFIRRANSNGYSQIPYATEQGIFAAITGNFLQRTGNFAPEHGLKNWSESSSLRGRPSKSRPPMNHLKKWFGNSRPVHRIAFAQTGVGVSGFIHTRGKVIRKQPGAPARGATTASPPCRRAICRTRARPSPDPVASAPSRWNSERALNPPQLWASNFPQFCRGG
jgi:hypothetical protein